MLKRKSELVSIVVPVFNEQENLPRLLDTVSHALANSHLRYEVLIVNDNSTDGTGKLAEKLSAEDRRIRVIHRSSGPAFGEALKTGFSSARGSVIIPLMGDLSDDPADIPNLLSALWKGYDVAIGSRFIPGSSVEGYPKLRMLANRCFNLFAAAIFNLQIKDLTNALKAYRRGVLDSMKIESNGFEINAEIPLKAHLLGFTMIEVPVSWRGRKKGVSKLRLRLVGPKYVHVALNLYLNGVEVQGDG